MARQETRYASRVRAAVVRRTIAPVLALTTALAAVPASARAAEVVPVSIPSVVALAGEQPPVASDTKSCPSAGPLERSGATYAVRLAMDLNAVSTFTTPAAAQPSASTHRRGALFWMGVGAGAGLLVAVVGNATAPSCRKPEGGLCKIALVTFPAFGAVVGLIVGP